MRAVPGPRRLAEVSTDVVARGVRIPDVGVQQQLEADQGTPADPLRRLPPLLVELQRYVRGVHARPHRRVNPETFAVRVEGQESY